jgi:hypothetical protein
VEAVSICNLIGIITFKIQGYMSSKPKSYPVPPNSVYVWRGYMNPSKTYADFAKFLGEIFVPACALLQPPVGLRAYFPTLVPQEKKPASIPDQTALMFWATPQSHNLANATVAIRVYQNLHGDLYDMKRSGTTEVPVALPGNVNGFTAEQPYFLFDAAVDWMHGNTLHVVGARPVSQTPADFLASVFQWASDFQKNTPAGIDATLVCCGNDYAVAWAHATDPSINISTSLDPFAALLEVQLNTIPRSVELKEGLWNKWDGIDYTKPENTSLNVQLKRPEKTDPVE